MFVATLYGNIFFLFMPVENVHQFSNFFQLMPVLFSCAISDFLYKESSCNAYSF